MDIKKRQLLQQHHEAIIQDLDVTYILDELFTKNAISSVDYDQIIHLSDRGKRAHFLLDALNRNGTNDAYQAFVDSLAKDYDWLNEKLTDNNSPMANDSFEDSLSKGDVPRLPDHHVRRIALEQELAEILKSLVRHKIVAVHGMSGSGKTSVVLSTLRNYPDLVTESFKGGVFWLDFGNCKTDDDIIALQSRLLRKVSSMYIHNSSLMNSSISMSSIASNGDSQSSSMYDWTLSDLKDRLKAQFAVEPVRDALLVLDEVNDQKCLTAFDIGCKILVTMRDTAVVANKRPQIIEIKNSLEEKESLEIFASFLDLDVSRLPRQANHLHENCKGVPFHITLIAAQLAENKEKLLHDPKHWNYFVKKFEKKESFFLSRYHTKNPINTIEVCINSLSEKIQPLYRRLKILPDNVKVSASVLSKLWNKDVSTVVEIMRDLRNKSMIIETYDPERQNYMYEVHILIMNYLRSKGDMDSKKIHAEFLNNYSYDQNNAPVEIVNDGYIAFYIGYHIMHTENYNNMHSLFNKLFLNLEFLGNKVTLTGSADVLSDLQKYENYISTDRLDLELLFGIKQFLSTHGADLYHYPYTNIVQSILQNECKGALYSKASQIAQENSNKNELYFEFLHEQNFDEIKPSTIDVSEKLRAVCFFGNFVLIGTSSGVIKFYHIPTYKLHKQLRGPGSPITWIGVSCYMNPIVVALFSDGSLKLWYVDDLQYDDASDIIEEESEENNCRYGDTHTISPKMGPYLNCRWSNSEQFLIMHTKEMVVFYDPSPNQKNKIIDTIDNFERGREIQCCVPFNHDQYVIVATKSSNIKCVEVIDLKSKERVITFEETDVILDMVTVPGSNKIITLKANEVMEYEVKMSSGAIKSTSQCGSKRVIESKEIKEGIAFLSIAVNKSGTLLFVSTDDNRVVCIDLKTYTRSFDLENRRGNIVSMATSESTFDEFEAGSDVLLTGTGTIEHSAKVWYLDPSYISQTAQKNGKVRLTTKFDASFLSPVSPQTPTTPSTITESMSNLRIRHQSFNHHKESPSKRSLKNTLSLDRHSLKPLNLKGICNNNDGVPQPLLTVVDDKNNIQVMRGQNVISEIAEKSDEYITRVKIAPCNQYIVYGLKSGAVKKYTIRTKETVTIMDVYSKVNYLNFVHRDLLIVAGQNKCLMAYRLCMESGKWETEMIQRGNNNLGSQELLNDIQGVKKKIRPERPSSSSSETSINSKDPFCPNGERKSLNKGSSLVDCFWLDDVGLITVESNSTTKLWSKEMKLLTILIGRQTDVCVTATAFQNNVLVICDKRNKGFKTYELRMNEGNFALQTIKIYKLNDVIVSCDLTADGNILAMGLDSGNVLVWNVRRQIVITHLKHHKTKVHSCSFSPVPDRSNRSSLVQLSPHLVPSYQTQSSQDESDDQPPLVLVTMAAEIVWWNITSVMKARATRNATRPHLNILSPITSPVEPAVADGNKTSASNCNMFFGDNFLLPKYCWKAIWKGKHCKRYSKRQDMLACIKLSGMNAKRLCHDDKFSCFVTVDNPGHIHIMNVMKTNNT